MEREEVTALYSNADPRPESLQFVSGDRIVLTRSFCSDAWWYGTTEDGRCGYFPPSLVTFSTKEELLGDGNDLWQDEEFFESYGALKIQHEMLSDLPRTALYQKAIETHKDAIKDKIVMDIGCGTGILSLFCAKAGAQKVYSFEASSMANFASAIVKKNNFHDQVEILHSKVERYTKVIENVDLIISEWMGTLLFFLSKEGMIESVLYARDRFLNPDGIMFPSHAQLFFVPVSVNDTFQELFGFWDEKFGFDMSPLKEEALRTLTIKPKHDQIFQEKEIFSDPFCFLNWDMKVLTVEELEEMEGKYCFEIKKTGELHGLGAWFDVEFKSPFSSPIILSTAPNNPPTHWKQTLLFFDKPLQVQIGDKLDVTITISRNKIWRRHFNIRIRSSLNGGEEIDKLHLLWR